MSTLHSPVRIGDWRLDPAIRCLRRDGAERRIEPKTLEVLMLLVGRAGRPVSREEIEREVWAGAVIGDDLLNRAIWKLRQALGDDPAAPTYIETIPRVGYRLVAPVGVVDPDARSEETATQATGHALGRVRSLAVPALMTLPLVAAVFWLSHDRAASEPDAPGRIVPLTSTPGYEAAPAVSADGRFVAFQKYVDDAETPGWVVALIDASSGITTVVDAPPGGSAYGPVWSPASDSIAWIRQKQDCEIVAQRVANGVPDSSPTRIAACDPRQSHEVVWDADGSFILASSAAGQSTGLVRLQRETNQRRTLTTPPIGHDGDRRPRPSPDGNRLAFVRQRTAGVSDIYLYDAEHSTEPIRLTRDHRAITDIAWTAAGDAIVFSSNRGGDSRLWMVDIGSHAIRPLPMSGRNAARISLAADSVLVYEEYFGDSDVWIHDAASRQNRQWTGSPRSEWAVTAAPDGNAIAFLSDRTGSAEIWLVDAAGGEPRRLTRLEGARVDPPQWSPDGSRLIFAAATNGEFDVFVVDRDGVTTPVSTEPGDERYPAFWDDDVVYSANRTGTAELWRLASDGSAARRITAGGGLVARAAPDGSLLFTRADEPGLWRITRALDEPRRLWPEPHPVDGANWSPSQNGFVYLATADAPTPTLITVDLRTLRADTLGAVAAEAPDQAGVAVLTGGDILFTRVVRSESDLWISRRGH